MSLIYLASPYTHPEPSVRIERFNAACKKAAALMRQGYSVFSPVAHSHPIADHLSRDLLLHHDFWMKQDLPWLERASKVVVLTLAGWEHSKGVAAEIRHARSYAIPIEHHNMHGIVFQDPETGRWPITWIEETAA